MTRELRSLEPPDDDAASLHSGNPACRRSVSGLALPRSAGRVSALARERPVALSRGVPSASKSSPRGFSTRLSPKRSCLAAPVPSRFTPSRRQPITRASRAPQTWVECDLTPTVASHRESAERVCELSARTILSVGVQGRQSPVVSGTELTRVTPAVNSVASKTPRADGGILSLNQERPSRFRRQRTDESCSPAIHYGPRRRLPF